MNEHFEELWKAYPRREGKKLALSHYKASVKDNQDKIDIVTALRNYLKYIELMKYTYKYIMQAKTWFNNWSDFVDYDFLALEINKEKEVPESLKKFKKEGK